MMHKYGPDHSMLTGIYAPRAIELSHIFHDPRPDKNFYLSEDNALLVTTLEHGAYHILLKALFKTLPAYAYTMGGLTQAQNEYGLRKVMERVYKNTSYLHRYAEAYALPEDSMAAVEFMASNFWATTCSGGDRICGYNYAIERNLRLRNEEIIVPRGLSRAIVTALWES